MLKISAAKKKISESLNREVEIVDHGRLKVDHDRDAGEALIVVTHDKSKPMPEMAGKVQVTKRLTVFVPGREHYVTQIIIGSRFEED